MLLMVWQGNFFLLKFIYSKKATKFEELSLLVLTLLSKYVLNVKTKISLNFSGLLRKPHLYIVKNKHTKIEYKISQSVLSGLV